MTCYFSRDPLRGTIMQCICHISVTLFGTNKHWLVHTASTQKDPYLLIPFYSVFAPKSHENCPLCWRARVIRNLKHMKTPWHLEHVCKNNAFTYSYSPGFQRFELFDPFFGYLKAFLCFSQCQAVAGEVANHGQIWTFAQELRRGSWLRGAAGCIFSPRRGDNSGGWVFAGVFGTFSSAAG